MTPKVKAQELVDKFKFDCRIEYECRPLSVNQIAKQCAIIAVNEVIKEVNIDCANSDCQQQTGYNI